MATDDELLEQLAATILDGHSVDWSAAESDLNEGERRLIQHLRVVAAVASVHRPPETWGHLRLVERIGSGTSGDVYRAWDTRLDREVALKLLPATASKDDRESSIIHEGRLLARVRHANVVTIHGAERIGDHVGLWMELVQGRTLAEMLAGGHRFTTSDVAGIGIDLCGAVEAVHRAGLIHRDIKAHNVMLAADGRLVLMDFGAGREIHDRSSSDLTGTPLYVAPEVLSGQPATAQSDVYSLGVLLFHLLTRSYPVQGSSVAEIRTAHTRPHASLRAMRPDVPGALARTIERAIDPVTDRRYPGATAVGLALRDATSGPGRRRLIFSAVAGVTVMAAAGWVWRDRRLAGVGKAPAIAVLPFDNTDAASGNEEFADGLTREIQRSLAVIDGLDLRSAGSSFAFRNRPRDLQAVAAALNVDFVVEGSVSRVNTALRVGAQLIQISSNAGIWDDRFERNVRDLPAIVDEIVLAIVKKLGIIPGRGQRRYYLEPDLYGMFLRALAFHGRRGPQNSAKAAELFQQVVKADPLHVPSWAGLANALAQLSRPSTGEALIERDPRLASAALTAFQLDPVLAESNAAIANMFAGDRDWVNARMAFLRAIELNSTLTEIHNDFVLGVLMPLGKVQDALRQFEAARTVDPWSLDVMRTQAHVFIEAGLYADAIENCRWIKQHDPTFPFVDVWLGRALYFSGQFEEAQEALERAGPEFFGYLGYMLAISGRTAEAEALAAKHPDAPSRTMLIYAGLNDRERAFEGLVRTAEINWWRAATWLHRREMALLRDDPRMPALRRKLGLE